MLSDLFTNFFHHETCKRFPRHKTSLTHSHTMTPFDALGNKPFENTVGKGEIAHNEQFLLYPVFSTRLENFLLFSSNLKLASADCFNLDPSKILSSSNGLTGS